MGVSPATGPTPNKGYEAAAMQRVSLLMKMASETLPMAGASSDVGKLLLDFLTKASKLVPPGSNTQASERNQLDQMQMKNAQQAQTMKSMQPGAGALKPPMQPGAGMVA